MDSLTLNHLFLTPTIIEAEIIIFCIKKVPIMVFELLRLFHNFFKVATHRDLMNGTLRLSSRGMSFLSVL